MICREMIIEDVHIWLPIGCNFKDLDMFWGKKDLKNSFTKKYTIFFRNFLLKVIALETTMTKKLKNVNM